MMDNIEESEVYALDILNLDEDIIDEHVNKIISKSEVSERQLRILSTFIKYKHMICAQEGTDCENDLIIEFILKELMKISNISHIRFRLLEDILTLSLNLNAEKFINFVEHFIQQLLCEINSSTNENESTKIVYLKIIECLANSSYKRELKPEFNFIKDEFYNLINCQEKDLSVHIFSTTIPSMMKCFGDYSVLNIIWDKTMANFHHITINDIKILCTLSEFYFPSNATIRKNIKSSMIKEIDFWKLIQLSLINNDIAVRKCANYLAKRAIDYAVESDRNININQKGDNIPYFAYNVKDKLNFENIWSTFFVIIETLEEKPFHLVEPALNLLQNITILHPSWYNCLLKRALVHETDLVLIKSLEMVLKLRQDSHYTSLFPYKELIGVLSKIFIYDEFFKSDNNIMVLLKDFLAHENNFEVFIDNMGNETLSPIPRFFISYTLMSIDGNKPIKINIAKLMKAFFGESRFESNNLFIENGTQCCLLNFISKHLSVCPDINDLYSIFLKLTDISFHRHSKPWNDFCTSIKNYNSDNSNRIIENIFCLMKDNIMDLKPLIKIIVLYYDASVLSEDEFIQLLSQKLLILNDSDKRVYAQMHEFDLCYLFITHVLSIIKPKNVSLIKLNAESDKLYDNLTLLLNKYMNVITSYLLKRLQNQPTDFELIDHCIEGLECLFNHKLIAESLFFNLQSIIPIAAEILREKDYSTLQKYYAIKIVSAMSSFVYRYESFSKSEKLHNLKAYFETINYCLILKPMDKTLNNLNGSLTSEYNQMVCKISYHYYNQIDLWDPHMTSNLYEHVLDVLEKGGSECLLWPIKLSHILIKKLAEENSWEKISFLINRIWKEILQVRKNHQFRKCMESLIEIVFNEYSNQPKMQIIAFDYGRKLLEMAELTPYAAYALIKHISSVLKVLDLDSYATMITEILLFGSVLRKDQRIEYDVCNFIETNKHVFSTSDSIKHISNLNNQIKFYALDVLIHQKQAFHKKVVQYLQEKIFTICKAKHRYHANSLNHRILFRALQSLILLFKFTPSEEDSVDSINWCIDILNKQPHHISIRLMLEWYISLHLVYNKTPLKKSTENIHLSQLPHISYFMIIFHVVKHQVLLYQNKIHFKTQGHKFDNIDASTVWENYNFAMNVFIPFTMGQIFNVRLHAQYLTMKLYQLVDLLEPKLKYTIIYDTINTNFELCSAEKNLKKIQDDFYINQFDVVASLNVNNIYHSIPKLTGIAIDEWLLKDNILLLENYIMNLYLNTDKHCLPFVDAQENEEFDISKIIKRNETSQNLKESDDSPILELSGGIQKKFVPWKNMLTEMGIESVDKKEENDNNKLIVVASLIDRIPNLGGLSRTCEVFGVKQYVINSLRHLQDKQFQSLSVSSEKWLDIKEIRPGPDLKKYLMEMKERGYKIVGAEQTSSSISLTTFSFPKNMILLLGHEKEGIPPDLLHIMDYCIEIPQHGMVRSLNVHVTASIFIWEYMRQNNS